MMFGWHHLCNGHELGHTLGDGGRQGDLACCSPCSHKEPDTTWQLNNKEIIEHNPSSLLLQFSYSLLTTVTWVVFCLFCFFYGLLCVCVFVCAQSHLILCNPMDCSHPGSSVCGIFLARILERVAFRIPGDLPNSDIETACLVSPALAEGFLTTVPPEKALWLIDYSPNRNLHIQRNILIYSLKKISILNPILI